MSTHGHYVVSLGSLTLGALGAKAAVVAGAHAVGFGTGGVVAGSAAASAMSGGVVVAGSAVSILQSIGAVGAVTGPVGLAVGGTGAVVGLVVGNSIVKAYLKNAVALKQPH